MRHKPTEPKYLRRLLDLPGYAIFAWSMLYLPHLPLGLISRIIASILLGGLWGLLVSFVMNLLFKRRF